MDFEWDPQKAASNVRKHGVYFADAVLVLEDERALTVRDDASQSDGSRSAVMRVLTVVYVWRGNAIRMISARLATKKEQQQYWEGA